MTDLSCLSDIGLNMAEVSGRRELAEAIGRRYITPRGGLVGDPNYGFDLTGYVNDDLGPADLGKIQAQAEAEALKDERVEACEVAITLTVAGILIVVVTLTDAQGPFSRTLRVDEVSVQLLKVAQ